MDEVITLRSDEDWLEAQKKDEECVEYLEAIGEDQNTIVPLDGLGAQQSEKYLYRPRMQVMTDGTMIEKAGPLMRYVIKDRNLDTKHTSLRLRQTYEQRMVPKSLRDKMMWILHDQMGHPGRTRTVETAKLKYYWKGMDVDMHKQRMQVLWVEESQ
jgi:hypothetical protein